MFLTIHAAAGAVIGNSMPNPIFAFLIGFVSHFVLDRIPHIDPNLDTATEKNFHFTKPVIYTSAIAFIDTIFVILLAYILIKKFPVQPMNTIYGIIGSILPDYLIGLSVLIKNKYLSAFERFHRFWHFDEKKILLPWYAGSIIQVTLLVSSVYLLLS